MHRFTGLTRVDRTPDHLLLSIDPDLRHVLPDGSEGDLVDWFEVASKVREDVRESTRIQSKYPESPCYYEPPFGSLIVNSSRELTTPEAKTAEKEALLTQHAAQRERTDAEQSARRDRFDAALTGAGIPLDYPGAPSYEGLSGTFNLSLAQLEGLLQRANK